MQLDSEQNIATLKADDYLVTIEVRGDVKVWFNPDTSGDPGDGTYYSCPSEFPQELKDIIAGDAKIYRKDGDISGIDYIWTLDDRVYVSENNWFELFIYDKEDDPMPVSDVVDVEGMTPSQVFDTMYEALVEHISQL
jgi:hypothetical protein